MLYDRDRAAAGQHSGFGEMGMASDEELALRLNRFANSGVLVFHGVQASAFRAFRDRFDRLDAEGRIIVELCRTYADADSMAIVEVWSAECGDWVMSD